MAEDGNTPPEGGSNNAGAGEEYTPPASQADLDRIIGERLARERQKFADYDDLKTRASEYDRLVEASKTDQQRLEERASTIEQQNQQLSGDLARLNVALQHGFVVQNEDGSFALDKDAVDLLGRGTEEELIERAGRIAALRGSGQKPNQQQPDLRPLAGQRPVPNGENADDWLRRLAGRG